MKSGVRKTHYSMFAGGGVDHLAVVAVAFPHLQDMRLLCVAAQKLQQLASEGAPYSNMAVRSSSKNLQDRCR
jgi:hypothetical protein